jgi:MSHA type pilus biogenesis protein MshL
MKTHTHLRTRALLLFASLLGGYASAQDAAPAGMGTAQGIPGGPDAGATAVGASAVVAPTEFSFRAEGVPIKQALALFARANGLNIVPDLDVEGDVTVEFRDLPLDLAMQALLDANGYYFVQEGRLLRVKSRETRLFQIDYIHVTRSGQGSNAVQISSGGSSSGGSSGSSSGGGGSGGNEGSTMTVTNSSTINFWGDLADQLKTLVSENGSITINSQAGTVIVRDRHRNIEAVADYLARVTENIVRQVDLEVEIYEVALNNSFQLGINWQKVSSNLDTTFSTLPGSLSIPSSGGLIVQNPIHGGTPSATGIQIAHQRGSVTAILDALKQQGDLKIVSKPRLRTLNNQPAVVRVGQDIPVFSTKTTVAGDSGVMTKDETIQTITVGTILSITPQVSSGGVVTLDITPAVSRLVRTETSATGNTNAPVIDIRQASSIVRVRDGATVIMGGLVQDSTTSTQRKVPLLGDIPLLGKAFSGTNKVSERTELVFFITPRVIADTATEASVATPASPKP